ncbi:uncharacterized protein LOC6567001 [Drosophila grimshawi]|uniref:GH13853 n=1 Tax=Drosophila grimshawi TaxID=7222 RepID=B4JP23_DROGR|nr:uncharacterized protein LOC6567001 [Drosophila grimshawi]EDV99448.1 GH13853 [Drosophila grimshawi]
MDASEEKSPEAIAAELRRENRRKKILQTAKSRLEKLNGSVKTFDENHIDSGTKEDMTYSDPEVEPNIPAGLFPQDDGFNRTFFAAANLSTPTIADNQNIFVKSRVHIFIASVVGYILSHFVTNSLFVPVGLCMMYELFSLRGQPYPTNSILSLILPIALLFTGTFLGSKVKQINCLLYISQSLIVNLAINIFCICLSSLLFEYISVNHFVNIK